MAEQREIPVGSLLLDSENPRLDQVEFSQAETIHRLVENQGEKLLVLAEDILKFGLDPISLMLVMPSPSSEGRFIVLEGNRRVAALKILNNPDLAGDTLSSAQLTRLRRLSQRFLRDPIKALPAVVVENRNEADHWLERRHRGEQQGAGVVSWGAIESARFDERRGRKDPALKVLDFVRHGGTLDETTRSRLRNLPITNLQRLLNDPDVRSAIGIHKERGEIHLLYPQEEVLKGLTRFVRDLAHDRINVYDIDTKEERQKYLASFAKKELPDPSKRLRVTLPLSTLTGVPAPGVVLGKPKALLPPSPLLRKTVIPRPTALRIPNPRIAAIFRELKTLPVDNYPNGTAVLFRVFLELSVDHYVLEKGLMTEPMWENTRLPSKIQTVANDLKKAGLLTNKQLQPVRRLTNDPRMLAASLETFHAYVHNKDFSPVPGDLKVAWDNLALFFAGIWR